MANTSSSSNKLTDVIAYAGWSPDVALVAIRRGWVGDCWVTRETLKDDWVFHGAFVTDAQKVLLADVYKHAKTACDLREKCRNWYKAHPESDADGYVYPEELIHDLSSIDFEQGFADDGLEDLLAEHPELVAYAKSNPAVK